MRKAALLDLVKSELSVRVFEWNRKTPDLDLEGVKCRSVVTGKRHIIEARQDAETP